MKKLYQIGVDLMVTDDGKIYLIENNTNCFLILPNKHHDLNKNKNEYYAIKRYIESLLPYFCKNNVKNIKYEILKPKYNKLFKSWESLGYDLHSLNPDVEIIYTHNTKTKNLGDKKVLEQDIDLYKNTGISFISDFSEHKIVSNTPNFLLKPKNGLAGKGIEMYKQPNKISKENYVRQEYIKSKQQDYLLEYNGKELVKFELGSNRLYDIRSIIYISEDGDIIFSGAYKRVSGYPLPNKLPDGKLSEKNTKIFLCNTSQHAYRSFMEIEEEMEYEEISLKIGKVLYENYIK